MAADRTRQLSSAVREILARVRGQIRWRVLVDGVLVATLSVLVVFWCGAILDYAPVTLGSNETPRGLRMALLAAMGGLVAWALVWRLARRLFRPLPDRSLALLLERNYPQLNNELVTVVELSGKSSDEISNPVAYEAMLERVEQSAAVHASSLDTRGLINWRPVYSLGWITGLLLLFSAGMAIAKPEWMKLWSSRLFALSDERWPRMASIRAEGVQLQLPAFAGQLAADRIMIPFEDNMVKVPRGSAVALHVMADVNARQVPELCTLFYQLQDGSRGRANMRRLGGTNTGWQPFLLDGPPLVDLTGDVTFDVIGGDARLDDLKLQVIDPAVITSMQLDLTYPPYLRQSNSNLPEREALEFRSGTRIPEGTQVVLRGKASGPLRDVQYVVRTAASRSSTAVGRAGQSASGMAGASSTTNSSASELDPALASTDGQLKILNAVPSGDTFEVALGALRDTAVVEIRLIDQFGLSSDQIPRYVVTVTEDTLPEVEVKLAGIGSAITPKAMLPLGGKVVDDHGLARVWSTIVVNEQRPVEIDLPVDAEGQLATTIDLVQLVERGALRVAPDSTLGLAVSALDRFDLAGVKHVGNGQPMQLAIVTEDKLLIMLDRQELELRQRLELIINELTQLRDVLRELGGTSTAPAAAKGSAAVHSQSHAASILTGMIASPPKNALTLNSLTVNNLALNNPQEKPAPDEATKKESEPERPPNWMLLRAQQSVLQGDKSQQELVGVATRVEEIRLQLVNNRIDSIDRQARLRDRVYLPMKAMLADEMETFRSRLMQLQSAALSPTADGAAGHAAVAAQDNERVLAALNAIVANMLDLESFNEIIDLVRGILDDEQRLLDETQKKQKQAILDLLK